MTDTPSLVTTAVLLIVAIDLHCVCIIYDYLNQRVNNYRWVWHGEIPNSFVVLKMAGISFLDLMFAEALASGLAREAQARRTERPPPDNFYLLPRDPNAWKQIQTACKKENMVIAVEITDNINENCKRVQSLFVDMAREFDSIPFLRAQVGLGNTFEEVSVAIVWVLLIYTLCPS